MSDNSQNTQANKESFQHIGIIGAGAIGQAMAKQAVRAGLKVTLSNSRGPESLAAVIDQLGPNAHAGSVRDAAAADIVVLSVNWAQLPSALAGLPSWDGRIVIDATNPVIQPGYQLAELGGRNSGEVVTDMLPGARLVKSFNTLLAAVLASDPKQAGGKRVVFLSGDDAVAKSTVEQLIERLGFASIDLGSLAVGGKLQQFPGGPLPAVNLIKVSN
ncbi:NADPH-dependent F420 reductase [Collimonas arenae]|nr:NAD(P)-binding domain-containing protein [Collimonas arenae]